MLAVSSYPSTKAAPLATASCSIGTAHPVSPSVVTSFNSSNAPSANGSTHAPAASTSATLPKTMVVVDAIYGSFTITEVRVELQGMYKADFRIFVACLDRPAAFGASSSTSERTPARHHWPDRLDAAACSDALRALSGSDAAGSQRWRKR